VITGDHKGEQGKVLRIDRDKRLVVVEGINMVYRHMRPSRRYPQGGRIQKEAPIHISNVLPVDPKTGAGSRVRFEMTGAEGGRPATKKRLTRQGTVLNQLY